LSLIENTHPVHHARLINLIDIPGIASAFLFFLLCPFFLAEEIPSRSFWTKQKKEEKNKAVCVYVYVTCLEYDSITSVLFLTPPAIIHTPPQKASHINDDRQTTTIPSIPHAPGALPLPSAPPHTPVGWCDA
jgi:hypothetical protein